MILVYKPENGDEQRWDLSEVKPTFGEAKAVERVADCQWSRLEQEIVQGNVEALQAILWVMRKRTETTLTYADLEDLPLGAADVEYSDDEKAFMLRQLESDESLSDEDLKAVAEMLGLSGAEDAPKEEADL